MSLKARQRAFLNKTVKYYNSTNRGIDPRTKYCTYRNGCAIGRFLKEDDCIKLDVLRWSISDILYDKELNKMIPVKIKNLGSRFLRDIQVLHDVKQNWNEQGLTEYGEESVNQIMNSFELKGAK